VTKYAKLTAHACSVSCTRRHPDYSVYILKNTTPYNFTSLSREFPTTPGAPRPHHAGRPRPLLPPPPPQSSLFLRTSSAPPRRIRLLSPPSSSALLQHHRAASDGRGRLRRALRDRRIRDGKRPSEIGASATAVRQRKPGRWISGPTCRRLAASHLLGKRGKGDLLGGEGGEGETRQT
jgi:hypothetical protein